MEVRDVMSTHVHVVQGSESVTVAAQKMRKVDVGCLVVMSDDDVVGVVTDRDLAIRCMGEEHDFRRCTVSKHTSSPAVTVAPSMDMLDAARLMTERRIRRLPVVEQSKLVGLVSLSDVALVFDDSLEHMTNTVHVLLRGVGASRSA